MLYLPNLQFTFWTDRPNHTFRQFYWLPQAVWIMDAKLPTGLKVRQVSFDYPPNSYKTVSIHKNK